jgi:DNA repair ATPase RecN
MSDREVYIEKMAAKLKEWDAKIEKLEIKAKASTTDVKKEYNREIEDLKRQREKVQAKIHKLRESGDDAWDELKAGLEKSWKTLGNAFDGALKKLKS